VIGFLSGIILQCTPERVLLDVQGVGYALSIPLSTFYEIEKVDRRQPVGLFVHTHVREDAIELFGFWVEQEKLLFEKLIQVSGIGPRLARVILSGMPSEQLFAALAAGDTNRLATIPGIGKKTAERMVVDLKDKVRALAAELEQPTVVDDTDSDMIQALVNLGYRESLARRAVVRAREESPDAPFHELLRLSLQRLARV
jgi:Holliday junction DNA helicase RuvA